MNEPTMKWDGRDDCEGGFATFIIDGKESILISLKSFDSAFYINRLMKSAYKAGRKDAIDEAILELAGKQ